MARLLHPAPLTCSTRGDPLCYWCLKLPGMVVLAGVEPATVPLTVRCSTRLSYSNEPRWDSNPRPANKDLLLYLAELQGGIWPKWIPIRRAPMAAASVSQKNKLNLWFLTRFGFVSRKPKLPNALYRAHALCGFLTFYTEHLFECVYYLHQIGLRCHHFFDGFVSSWSFVDNALILAALNACSRQLVFIHRYSALGFTA